MEKIKTSHLIYFFVLLFPLTNFVLPFFFYGDEMSIRIYVEGTFTDVPSAENNVFPDDGVYSIGKHQGYEHKIDPKSIYISMLYILIFFLQFFLLFHLKTKI